MSESILRGAIVVSLDFELGWGFDPADLRSSAVRSRILHARALIPRLLETFEEFDIAATWAVVGALFATSREELEAWTAEGARGTRRRSAALPDGVGRDENEDPLHYAPSLIRAIQGGPRQEIATHTFSHYYCLEPGQSAEDFAADLESARRAARGYGLDLRSIVFPRNQHNPAYDGILLEHGITSYRGNPRNWAWRFDDTRSSRNPARRALRLLDNYAPVTGTGTTRWEDVLRPSGLSDVRATRPLAPYRPVARVLERLRRKRIQNEIRYTALHDRLYHIWWHPHNFGSSPDRNMAFLRWVLEEVARCREEHGLSSLSMADVDRTARERTAQPAVASASSG